MKLKCQKIKILEKGTNIYQVKFLEEDITMSIEKSIVEAKISTGFYKVIQ